jgi:hypothetical protein
VNLFYVAGIGFIATGCGFIYAAGIRDAQKELEAEKWRDADNSDLGSVDDVRRFRNGKRTSGDTA